MSVRLDHGEDSLSEVHEINVTPFIDVMLVLLIIFMCGAARHRRHPGQPAGIDRRAAAAAGQAAPIVGEERSHFGAGQ